MGGDVLERTPRRRARPARLLLLLAVALPLLFGGVRLFERQLYPLRYQAAVQQQARAYNIPPSFLYAVIRTESRFDPEAFSSAEAMGLMQITADAFEWAKMRMGEQRPLTTDDLYDPEVNIQYGSFIYALLLEEFGSPEVAVCAYHAGRGNVRHWLQNPAYSADGVHLDTIPYSNTRWYLAQIQKTQRVYQQLYHIE